MCAPSEKGAWEKNQIKTLLWELISDVSLGLQLPGQSRDAGLGFHCHSAVSILPSPQFLSQWGLKSCFSARDGVGGRVGRRAATCHLHLSWSQSPSHPQTSRPQSPSSHQKEEHTTAVKPGTARPHPPLNTTRMHPPLLQASGSRKSGLE